MKRKTVYELHADEYAQLRLYYFDLETNDVQEIEPNSYDELSKKLDCSTDLLETLLMAKGDINEYKAALRKDMIDIYREIDSIKQQLEKG